MGFAFSFYSCYDFGQKNQYHKQIEVQRSTTSKQRTANFKLIFHYLSYALSFKFSWMDFLCVGFLFLSLSPWFWWRNKDLFGEIRLFERPCTIIIKLIPSLVKVIIICSCIMTSPKLVKIYSCCVQQNFYIYETLWVLSRYLHILSIIYGLSMAIGHD